MDEHSFETDPHTFGWDCFFNGGSESDNPHLAESADFKRWLRGFHEAAAESADAHSCGAHAEWVGAEKFCMVCGKKTDEME